MNIFQNYTQLFKYFIALNPRAFFLLLIVAVSDSFISTITIISVAPFADFLSDPTLSKTNEVTEKILVILEFYNINPSLILFGVLFILSNILKSAGEITVKFVTLKIKYSTIERINTSLASALLRASWSHWKSFSQGKMLNTLTRETAIVGDLMGVICTQIAQIIKFIVLILFPIMLFPSFMSVLIVILFGLMLPYLFMQRLNQRLGAESTGTSNESMTRLYEISRSIRPIKSFLREKFVVNNYHQALLSHFAVATKAHTISFAIFTSYQTLGVAAIIMTTLMHETLLISEMAMIIWSMTQALPLVGRVLASNAIVASGIASFNQLMDTKQKAKLAEEKFDGAEILNIDKVTVQNVSYSTEGNNIIDGVNLAFRRGTISAFAGKSGSGKTTLAEMIGGFSQPTAGTIYFGNIESKDLNVRSLRKRISYCSQETLLIPGSIFDNLAFAQPNLSMTDAMSALEFADASEFVKNLPNGIQTHLGKNTGFLSGGEKQKLSLARSFLFKPDIYIFDEITASIDKTSEKKIYSNIAKLRDDAIVIFITHNVHALKFADQIHFIEKGRLKGSGTFVELAKKIRNFQRFIDASAIRD